MVVARDHDLISEIERVRLEKESENVKALFHSLLKDPYLHFDVRRLYEYYEEVEEATNIGSHEDFLGGLGFLVFSHAALESQARREDDTDRKLSL